MTAAAANSIFCIIDIRPIDPPCPSPLQGRRRSVTTVPSNDLAHLPVTMGAMEAEEVGVEHLLRDINDPTVSTVSFALIRANRRGLVTLAENFNSKAFRIPFKLFELDRSMMASNQRYAHCLFGARFGVSWPCTISLITRFVTVSGARERIGKW
jgi:hypothetical protein